VAPGETSPEECTPCEIDRKDKRIARLEAALREIRDHANAAEYPMDDWYAEVAEKALEDDDGDKS
jgi:hypothetical protein